MKLNRIIRHTAAFALSVGLAAAALAGEEVKITMDKVPAAVKEAVKAYATGTEIKGIEESDVDGTKVRHREERQGVRNRLPSGRQAFQHGERGRAGRSARGRSENHRQEEQEGHGWKARQGRPGRQDHLRGRDR
jgi:hypothetical protein